MSMCIYFSHNDSIFSLATETEHVRARLAQYGNDLISLGVDGLRLDAAKRTLLCVFPYAFTDLLFQIWRRRTLQTLRAG